MPFVDEDRNYQKQVQGLNLTQMAGFGLTPKQDRDKDFLLPLCFECVCGWAVHGTVTERCGYEVLWGTTLGCARDGH